MNERIDKIRSLLQKNPKDVFLHYSLGMEYASTDQYSSAIEAFSKCIELDETYVPAYVEAGKALRAAGRGDEARQIFTAGMEWATRKGENHTRDYIQQQLQGLPPVK